MKRKNLQNYQCTDGNFYKYEFLQNYDLQFTQEGSIITASA